MRRKNTSRANPWLLLWAILITGVIGTYGASAQTFFGLYGDHEEFTERGYKRVIPVLNEECSTTDIITRNADGTCEVVQQGVQTNGYIAVGFSDMPSQGQHDDVYIVRIDNEGNSVWEKTYDIGASKLNDTAWSIVELSPDSDCEGCFAIVGTAEVIGIDGDVNTDIFLMVIDNNGNVIFIRTYDNNSRNDYGRDIIQTQFFFTDEVPPVEGYDIPPRQFDLAFCGWTEGGGNNTQDGVIIRTDCNGNRVWDVKHDLQPEPNMSEEVYLSLTESLNNQASQQRNGDILVAGGQVSFPDPIDFQGLIGRVQGANGLAGPLGTGFANFGGRDVELFHSIIELSGVGPNPGDVVAVGETNTPSGGGTFDVYAVQLQRGFPCASPFVNLYIGDPDQTIDDHGRDVREVQSNGLSFAGRGDLVVTGFTNHYGGDDILLLPIREPGAFPLMIPPGFWFLYGDLGELDDQAISLADIAALQGRTRGVIMCGWTNSDPCMIGIPNTDDLFLVKTDNNGAVMDAQTGKECYDRVEAPYEYPEWPRLCLDSLWMRPYEDRHQEYIEECWDTDIVCCYTPSDKIDPSVEGKRAAPGTEKDLSGSMIRTRPNPVKGGQVFNLTVAPKQRATVRVTVTDMRGQEVFRKELPGVENAMELPISTDGWPSGAYLLKATDGNRIDAVRINVLE